jgi:CheY-like chemotaxis protein/HPt (histidine-containing phosphotransfer) domain-containing protein
MNKSILADKMVLIVDDYAVNRELLSMIVSGSGATPLTASNGLECVNIVKKHHVDMILMDNNMPVMNGIDATREIRLLPEGKRIIIVGISVSEDEKESALSLQSGMDHLQEKLTLNEDVLIKIGNVFFSGEKQKSESCDTNEQTSHEISVSSVPGDSDGEQMVFDYKKALHEFEDDDVLLKSLIIEFNSNITAQLSMMNSAFAKADFKSIQDEAHGMKGGAANLCALPLSNAAKSLELACRQKCDRTQISELLDATSAQIRRFSSYVNQLQQFGIL